MLNFLRVKNYIIIEELEIEFSSGFNVITGETGAGKSIILGALKLVLGARASVDDIRKGQDKSIIQAVFQISDDEVHKIKKECDIELDNEIIITREIGANRSISKLNGNIISLLELKKIGEYLIKIHGQNDNRELVNNVAQRELLDEYMPAEIKTQVENVVESYREYKELLNIQKNMDLTLVDEESREIFRKQISQIDEVSPNESDNDIDERYELLYNSIQIIQGLRKAQNLIQSDDEYNVLHMIRNVEREISSSIEYYDDIADANEKLNNISYELKEIARKFEYISDDLENRASEFEELEDRYNKVSRLKKLYGNTIEDIIKYRNSLEDKLYDLELLDEKVTDIEQKISAQLQKYVDFSHKLSCTREKYAKKMSADIEKCLEELNFDGAKFEIKITHSEEPSEYGGDDIEFCASLNHGLALSPIKKIASGGEISRMMLSIQSVIAGKSGAQSIIFDEIDTGISGRTASAVGRMMYDVSTEHQIIAVTHLSQVAIYADEHFLIDKKLVDGANITHLERLTENERTLELARIMGGDQVSDSMIENVRKLRSEIREKVTYE